MKKKLIIAMFMFFALSFGSVIAEQAKPEFDEKSLEAARKWDKTMAEFRRWDSKNTFPEDAILLVGSSSINYWPTNEYFPDLPVINRGFGGSIYSDITYWSDTLLKPYAPKIIVFYSGDNDPGWGKSPERIAADFKILHGVVRGLYPEVLIVVMATKLSESRERFRQAFVEGNKLLEEFASSDEKLYYFDSASLLLDKEGNPDPSLYLDDKLHLNAAGYEIWTENLRKLIDKLS